MNVLKKMREDYVIWHANRIKIPEFVSDTQYRTKGIFSGRVQKVGFRLEIDCLAQRLNLTGWVKNLEDGSVEAELQGGESKIQFLVHCMESLKRASVKNVTMIAVPIIKDDKNFTIVR